MTVRAPGISTVSVVDIHPSPSRDRSTGAMAPRSLYSPWPLGPGWSQAVVGMPALLDSAAEHLEPLPQRFGPRRAAGHVHVHRDQGVDALHDVVRVPDVPRDGARAHGQHPLGVGDLLVETNDPGRHLDRAPTRDDHAVGLPRRGPHGLHAEAGDVVAGPAVAIISMAQQASPKSSGHQEKVRPKPSSFSRLAGTAIPGMYSSSMTAPASAAVVPAVSAATTGGLSRRSDSGNLPLRAQEQGSGARAATRHPGETYRVAHSHSSTPFFHA